mmetsp:Transcript_70580/g.139876  ORF Transcript_70580/g.139876 Transcript_70580/m.139876 type:complete len:232 (+) Transcript_70580:675-1370(+)
MSSSSSSWAESRSAASIGSPCRPYASKHAAQLDSASSTASQAASSRMKLCITPYRPACACVSCSDSALNAAGVAPSISFATKRSRNSFTQCARAFCVITSVVATAVAAALSATWRSALCVFCLSPTPSAMMKLLWLEALAMEAARTILGRVARRVLFGRTPPPCIPLAMSFCPPFLFLGGVRGRRFFFFRAKQALTVSGLKLSISVSVESVVASSDSTSAVSGCVSLWIPN